jgi:L-aspartate semialdehyde sulfurtransferase ferredoxin
MIRIDGSLCELCGTCVGVCPVDAIVIEGTDIRVNGSRCIMCMGCVKICPVGAPEDDRRESPCQSPA